MLHLAVPEYGRIARSEIPTRLLKALRSLDRRNAATIGETALDWTLETELRAKNYVGVLQVPGLSIEILPKTDVTWHEGRAFSVRDDAAGRAQANLLYMLSIAGDLPIRERELAHLETLRAPLIEVLLRRFVEGLLDELRCGVDHAYVTESDRCSVVRGRILFREHLRNAGVDKGHVHVEYDEFQPDTPLNRVLKRACTVVRAWTTSSWTTRCLTEALVTLGEVSDRAMSDVELDAVRLHRGNARFAPSLEFARAILRGMAPAPRSGEAAMLSLLFPMETVFERFVGCFIEQNASRLGLDRAHVFLQARRHQRYLLRSERGGHFRLEPDVLVVTGDQTRLILDTKWKRLASEKLEHGVSQSDVYQLYAYSQRYACEENVLLFPRVPGVARREFEVDGDGSGAPTRRLRIEFLDVTRDLRRDREALRGELRSILARRGEE